MAESWWKFKDAAVGDFVAVYVGRDPPVKHQITDVLKTQITVNGIKYTRSRGYEVGVEWGRKTIEPWTDEIDKSIARRVAEVARSARQNTVIKSLDDACFTLKNINRTGHAGHSSTYPRELTSEQLDACESLIADFSKRAAEILLNG